MLITAPAERLVASGRQKPRGGLEGREAKAANGQGVKGVRLPPGPEGQAGCVYLAENEWPAARIAWTTQRDPIVTREGKVGPYARGGRGGANAGRRRQCDGEAGAGLTRPAGAHHPQAHRAEEGALCADWRRPPAPIPPGESAAGGLGFWVNRGRGACARGGLRPRPVRAPLLFARTLAGPSVTERRRCGGGGNGPIIDNKRRGEARGEGAR